MLTKKNTENTIAIRKKVNLAAHKQGYKVAQPFPIWRVVILRKFFIHSPAFKQMMPKDFKKPCTSWQKSWVKTF